MKQHPPHFCTNGDFMKMGYLLQSDKFQTIFFTQKMMNSHIIYEKNIWQIGKKKKNIIWTVHILELQEHRPAVYQNDK